MNLPAGICRAKSLPDITPLGSHFAGHLIIASGIEQLAFLHSSSPRAKGNQIYKIYIED